MSKHCTYIEWEKGTAISEAFLEACAPVVQRRDGFALCERHAPDIQKLAEKHKQSGLKVTQGAF